MANVASSTPHLRLPRPKPEVRQAVKDLLTRSAAFAQLKPKAQAQIAHDTAVVADYLARPASEVGDVGVSLIEIVDFPTFVSSLIKGVFQAIVKASIDQMEAYGKLVADVAKSLNIFRDENIRENQARDYLIEQFPHLFRIGMRKHKHVRAATRRLATRRQQLLATMLLMGINRIVVTDGKIQAKTS